MNIDLKFKLHNIFISLLILILSVSSSKSYSQCFDREDSGEICSKATYICGQALDGYTNTLPNVNSAPQQWAALCIGGGGGSADNILWFSFRPCSNRVTLEITVNNCYIHENSTGNNLGTHPDAGVQVGLFGECHPNRFLDCSANPTSGGGMTGTFRVSSNLFVPGELGYFYIDGYNINLNWLTICDFSIRVIEGIDTNPVLLPDPATLKSGSIYGAEEVSCDEKGTPISFFIDEPGKEIIFNTACGAQPNSTPKDTLCYNWQVSPRETARFNNNDSTGNTVEIIFDQPGRYIISADTEFNPYLLGEGCSNAVSGQIRSWEVLVHGPDTLVYPIEYVCAGTTTSFCGQNISQNQIAYCAANPCEVITKEFRFGAGELVNLGRQFVCSNELYSFQNVNYGVGTYSVLDLTDCNKEYRFEVAEIVIESILASSTNILNCDTPTIELQGQINTNTSDNISFYWKDSSGSILNQGNMNLIVDVPGDYFFVGEFSSSSTFCSTEDTISISSDFSIPEVEVIIPTLTCSDSRTTNPSLFVTSNDIFRSSQWTSPLGSVQNGLNIVIDSSNVMTGLPYRFLGVGLNGCIIDTSFTIKSNFRSAEIDMTGDDLSCYIPTTVIQVSTDITIDSIRWYKVNPNQFYGSHLAKLTHFVDQPGEYKVEVKASESKCWSEKSLIIKEDKNFPEIVPPSDILWHCNTESLTLTPFVTNGDNLKFSWGTNDGKIITATNQQVITITHKGTYQLNVLNEINGCESRSSIQIIEDPNVPASILTNISPVLCHDESNGQIEILSSNGGYEPYSYYINNTLVNSAIVNNLKPGDYRVSVKDKYECTHFETVTINNPPALEVNIGEDLELYFEENVILTLSSNYPSSDIVDIAWYNKSGELLGTDYDLSYSGFDSDIIELVITTTNGCQSRAKIQVSVDNKLEVYFPNIFSPNGDGINDRFVLYKNKIPAEINRVAIYDRLGNLVFESNGGHFGDDFIGWDGTFNGSYVQPGVYMLVIDITNFSGKREYISKDLTVVR